MAWKSYYGFAPYVPVAERRRKAAATAQKMNKTGRKLEPVEIAGRKIASTFWGSEWCENLEAYSDYANRLPRGRTYARNGSVIDLQISSGEVTALVMGSELYEITITVSRLSNTAWGDFKKRCSGKIASLLDLLQGRLDKGVLQEITRRPGGLFPSPKEIHLDCSCPDGAYMCKHIAAALYGVGARLDGKPELFFTLRGADVQELITAAASNAASVGGTPAGDGLDAGDLSDIFGVEIDSASPLPQAVTAAPLGKPAAKQTPKPKAKSPVKAPARQPVKLPVMESAKPPVKAKSVLPAKPPLKAPGRSAMEVIAKSRANAAKRSAARAEKGASSTKPATVRAVAKKAAKKASKRG